MGVELYKIVLLRVSQGQQRQDVQELDRVLTAFSKAPIAVDIMESDPDFKPTCCRTCMEHCQPILLLRTCKQKPEAVAAVLYIAPL